MKDRYQHQSGTSYVGKPVRRVNDHKFITGHGQFVDDIQIPGTLHVAFFRSYVSHANIISIDTSAASDLPGVFAVVTGAESDSWLKPDGPHEPLLPGLTLEHQALVSDRVRFVGDPIAAVFAESDAIAHDALDLIEVEFEELPGVSRQDAALGESAPILFDGWPSNKAWHWSVESGDIESAFHDAAHTIAIDTTYQRVTSVFMEPRSALADYDRYRDELTVWTSTQVPHRVRTQIADHTGIPEHKIRSIAPDVGGGFGSKGGLHMEYIFVAAAAHIYQRPVKWVATRSEHFLASYQGRDQIQHLKAAVSTEGRILGLHATILSNCGAYGAAAVATRSGLMSSGPYRIENLKTEVIGVMTNTAPTHSYRGAGRPEAAYMLERLIDCIADELDLDPVDVRRRNFIPADAFPYPSATGVLYDSGNYDGALDKVLAMAGWDEMQADIQQARSAGRITGAGLGVYCEFAGPGWDNAEVRVSPSGTVTVMTGISPHGQGNETSIAQIVADELSISMDSVTVKVNDTAIVPQGVGTFGSRGTAIGGGAALLAAREVGQKVCAIGAAMLEVANDDVELTDNQVQVIGAPDRAVRFDRIARAAHSMGPVPGGLTHGLDAQIFFSPDGRQFPFGVHLAQVEIDPETGEVSIIRYVAVDDCGTIINPLLVDGQKHGGLAQGFGQALWEEIIYDSEGQLITGTLMDYATPKAAMLPVFELDSQVTPSPFTPHGAKGVGEAGTTGAPPAIVNAVIDALRPFGVTAIDMPLSAEKIWQLIRNNG